jgi:predicted nucleic acid-binding protein
VKVVVDTNVVAYLLLGTKPYVQESYRFWHGVREAMAPALWEAELANVVWMAIRTGVVAEEEGLHRLELAVRLRVHSVASRKLWQGAVTRAVQTGLAAYDTLFIELASRERVPLATFDSRILSTFPEIAKRPGVLVPK